MSVATADFIDPFTLLPRAPVKRLSKLILRYRDYAETYEDAYARMLNMGAELTEFWATYYELAPSTLEPLINQDLRNGFSDHPVVWRYQDIFTETYLPLALSDDDKFWLADNINNTIRGDVTNGVWEDAVHHRYYDNIDSSEFGMFVGTAYRCVGCMFVIEVARTLLHCFCVDLRERGTKHGE